MAWWCLSAAILALGVSAAPAQAPAAPPPPAAEERPAKPADTRLSPARLDRISAAFLGAAYGHDAAAWPARVDCQTFIELVLARALARTPAEYVPTLNRIRYRNGVVKEEERYVYVIPDWTRGDWPARDVTQEVAEGRSALMTKIIDRAAFFRRPELAHRGGYVARERVDTPYIPRETAASRDYPDGSIAIFVQQREGIVAAHCGWLFRRGAVTLLRHASQTRHMVIEEPLAVYLARAPRNFVGLKVLVTDLSHWRD